MFQQEAFEKCWAHSRLRAASRPLTRCRYRYCRAPPVHRCPRRQRQRVTEGTAMAPWNGPNHECQMPVAHSVFKQTVLNVSSQQLQQHTIKICCKMIQIVL